MASERLSEQLERGPKPPERKTSEPSTDDGPENPVLKLQTQVGNAAVDRLLHQGGAVQRQEIPEEEEMLQATHDASLQRQEEEEEELQATHDASLQRQEEEEEEEMLQASHDGTLQEAKVGMEGGAVSSGFEQQLQSSRGGGTPVDGNIQGRMESALGTDLADVRVHRDVQSDSMTRNVTSSAFTAGNDIYLRGDQSPSDSKLMSHELTHVVQQRSMDSSGGGVQVGAAGTEHEQEADEVSNLVNSSALDAETEREG